MTSRRCLKVIRRQFGTAKSPRGHDTVQMQKQFMRIPYTGSLPSPQIIPADATTSTAAVVALSHFLTAPPSPNLKPSIHQRSARNHNDNATLVLSGAGISVASGLADYRGKGGTYTLNKTYRPIYFHEFCQSHEARKRYWARSFLGWTTLNRAKPNVAHWAVRDLGELGIVNRVITQSMSPRFWKIYISKLVSDVDSFHPICHPDLPTLELHGYLRSLVCLSCKTHLPRSKFQERLSALNPAWAAFLAEALASGALETENPTERRAKGMKTNPDGDVDLPDAPYTTFRYPACPTCLKSPSVGKDGRRERVEVDNDGAWSDKSNGGILKPAVVMFGESIETAVKDAAEHAVDGAGRLLVIGSSLATYSAWRLVKRAKERRMPIGILNLGGVRGEEELHAGLSRLEDGTEGVRIELPAGDILPEVVDRLRDMGLESGRGYGSDHLTSGTAAE
jgi:NAD-dependent deacetylase sirtuin 4